MRIITIGHRGHVDPFVFIAVDDDTARNRETQLKKADVNKKFDINVVRLDSFANALEYVKGEQK